MKDLKTVLLEQLNEDCKDCKVWTEEEENSIDNEKDFRSWAEAKFKEVFGDEFDEKKFKETVDGFLSDNKELVDNGEWGELVGMMNQSFAK